MTIYHKQQGEAVRLWDILSAEKAETLSERLAFTLAEERAETLDYTNSYTVVEAVANRFGNTSAMRTPRQWSIRKLPLYQRRTTIGDRLGNVMS